MSYHHQSVEGDLAVAVEPSDARPWVREAVLKGGGHIVSPQEAKAMIWGGHGPDGLRNVLDAGEAISWVQLPSAGIESYSGLLDVEHTWTCAKGIYAPAVAEHALSLALAGLHRFPELARRHAWQRTDCRTLLGASVAILGGGGIAQCLLQLLAPFGCEASIMRRHVSPMPGAARVVGPADLHALLSGSDIVILTLPLTGETDGIIGASELQAMKDGAWLVNVGRGRLVQTDSLVTALRERRIGGAALDVTEPEPLPDGHALWALDNCLITPHCGNPPSFEREAYSRLISENVRRRIDHEPLLGVVDPRLGY